jgi:hypothetical protein
MGLGKTIQVISFLSAIMRKYGDERDLDRRHKHVSELQDGRAYKKKKILPKANATWLTCLIIAVSFNIRLILDSELSIACYCRGQLGTGVRHLGVFRGWDIQRSQRHSKRSVERF